MDCHLRDDLYLLDLRSQQRGQGPQLYVGHLPEEDPEPDQPRDPGLPVVHHPHPLDPDPDPVHVHLLPAHVRGTHSLPGLGPRGWILLGRHRCRPVSRLGHSSNAVLPLSSEEEVHGCVPTNSRVGSRR